MKYQLGILLLLIISESFAQDFYLHKEGSFCEQFKDTPLNHREINCEQLYFTSQTIDPTYLHLADNIQDNLFERNELQILVESIQTELIYRTRLAFAEALTSIPSFAHNSQMSYAYARNACEQKELFSKNFAVIDAEYLALIQKNNQPSPQDRMNILKDALAYYLASEYLNDENIKRRIISANPLASFIPQNGVLFATFGKNIFERLLAKLNIQYDNAVSILKNEQNKLEFYQNLILKISEMSKDNHLMQTADQLAVEYWNSFWKRTQAICESTPCSVFSEDLQTTELLIQSLTSERVKKNVERYVCWCGVTTQKHERLTKTRLASGLTALGFGATCLFTGGGTCIAGAIAGGTSSVLELINIKDEYQHYQLTLNAAQKQSLVTIREELQAIKSSELIQARDDLEQSILLNGFGFGLSTMSGLANANKALNALMDGRHVLRESVDNAYISMIAKLKSGKLNDKNIIMLDDKNRGQMWLLNLKGLKSGPSANQADILAKDYWEFVGGVYKRRLKLSPEEVDDFIASSASMQERTLLLVNRQAGDNADEIVGGVGVVNSAKKSEKLPLESALNIELPRNPGENIIEVVRLSSEKTNPQMVKEYLYTIVEAAKQTTNPTKAYIFTSRVHARLYKRLGVPLKEVMKANDNRDVVLEVALDQVNQL